MKRKVFWLLLALLLAVSGVCEAPLEPQYEEIEFSLSRDAFFARFGEAKAGDDNQYALGDSLLCFFESGRLRAKIRAFARVTDVAAMCDADFSLAKTFRQGAPLEDVEAALGQAGAEILRMRLADEENAGMRRVLAWKNENGDALEALFELDDDEWRLFAAVQIPAGAAS